MQHDPRSRRYAYDTAGLSIAPVRHARHIPVLDQGELGSCTGNAAVGCIGCDPLWNTLTAPRPTLDEAMAVKIYSKATALDDDPDNYPPTDTGSTGLAAAKAMQIGLLIGGYQHTFSLDDALKALSVTPVMLGINWYSSFDKPDANGLVKIAKNATVRGGHEVCIDEITAKNTVGITNSWTTGWGLQGRFYMSFDTLARLLSEEGDVTIPVPGSAPSPTPEPAPVPDPAPTPPAPSPITGPTGPAATPDDVALWADMRRWAHTKGLS